MTYTDQAAWTQAYEEWVAARSAFEAAENKRIASLYQQQKLNGYALRWFELGNLIFAIWLYAALSERWPSAAAPVGFLLWLGGGIFWVWFLTSYPTRDQFQRRAIVCPLIGLPLLVFLTPYANRITVLGALRDLGLPVYGYKCEPTKTSKFLKDFVKYIKEKQQHR
jgi:hypothetical protein